MDRTIYISIAAITVVFILVVGDVLYIGLWYYIAIPASVYLVCIPFKPQKFFLSGAGLAILLAYAPYFIYNIFSHRPEGLLGLGHISSLPGLLIGALLAAIYLRYHKTNKQLAFLAGLCAALGGFLINQFVICNTLFHCSGLIWPLSTFTFI